MKQHTERFTPAALTLSVVTAALADGIPQSVPVRRALWLGAVSTACLCIFRRWQRRRCGIKHPPLRCGWR